MDVIRRLEALRGREHTATVELIEALCVCADRKDHLAAGHASIWSLLVERLHYSPAAASRRNAAVKIARRHRVALQMLRTHRTSLTCLAKIAHWIDMPDFVELLGAIDGASADEVDRIIAARRPRMKPRETIKRVVVRTTKAQPDPLPKVNATASKPVARPDSKQVAPPTEDRILLNVSLTVEDHARLERARAKASRKHGPGVSIEQTLQEMLTAYVDHDPKSRRAKKPTRRNRHIPTAIRRAVEDRDGTRCTFVAPDGTRCMATHDLQLDHVEPFAQGGAHSVANLRVLCGAHNRWRHAP